MSLLLVLSPNLKTSSMKTSRLLEVVGACFDTLLLNLPLEMEEELIRLVSGSMSIDEFVEEARRRHLMPEPIGMWEYSIRPILEALPRLDDMFQHDISQFLQYPLFIPGLQIRDNVLFC